MYNLKISLPSSGMVLSAKLSLQALTCIPVLAQRWSISGPGQHCRRLSMGCLLDYNLKSGDTVDVDGHKPSARQSPSTCLVYHSPLNNLAFPEPGMPQVHRPPPQFYTTIKLVLLQPKDDHEEIPGLTMMVLINWFSTIGAM